VIKPLPIHAGQRWLLTVKLKRPHGLSNPASRDSEAWAVMHDIGASGSLLNGGHQLQQSLVYRPSYLILRLREQISQRIQQVLKGKANVPVLQALAVGDDGGIDSDDWQTFRQTGVNHLISISGLHITMLAGLLAYLVWQAWRRSARLCLWLPARVAAAITGFVVAWGYALLAGFSVPTQRTVYMLLCFALALISARQISMMRVLFIAALLVVTLDPWALMMPGFYLSFMAVALFIFALSQRLGSPPWLSAAIRTQWVATLGLLPLLVLMFQQISLISPLANAMAIPVISLLVVPLTLIGALLGIDSALHLAQALMQITMDCLQALAALPNAVMNGGQASWLNIALGIMGVLVLLLPRGFPLRSLGVLMLAAMLYGWPAIFNSDTLNGKTLKWGQWNAIVFDVGQGLAVMVNTANHHLIFDTGPGIDQQFNSAQRVILPYLQAQGIGQLDTLIVSHQDSDHYGGMETLLSKTPTHTLYTSYPISIDINRQLQYPLRCHQGQSWQLDGVRFEMLYPDSEVQYMPEVTDNNRSSVLKVSSAWGSLLLTGDIEAWAEKRLLQLLEMQGGEGDRLGVSDGQAQILKSDILLIPHHGSKTSSTPAWLDAVQPSKAIATVGYRNRYHHPKAEIMQRYQSRGIASFRSDQDGAILIQPSEPTKSPAVSAWRKTHARYWHDQTE
jgi:competence protein ComEC